MPHTSAYLSPQEALSTSGYFVQRNVISHEDCEAIRADLLREVERLAHDTSFNDHLLEPSAKENPLDAPLHERFRKLSHLQRLPEIWNRWLAHPNVLEIIGQHLGDTIYNKFASAFLKPARIGRETPWHQDIGLWRDQNVSAMNGWLAIDAATKDNGCLQVVPGSHKSDIIEHVTYEDSIHGELPRDLCQQLVVKHIELGPGDAVFWHSNLWHYSPPNHSDQARLGCGGVWINPAQVTECHKERSFHVVMKQGERLAHPGEKIGPQAHGQTSGDY